MANTLRFRLAVGNALVVVLTAMLTTVGLRQGLYFALLHETDQLLAEDQNEIALALQAFASGDYHRFTEELERKAIGHQQHGWFVQLFEADGQLMWSTARGIDVGHGAGDETAVGAMTLGNHRVALRKVAANASGVHGVLVGMSLDMLRADLARIDRIALVTTLCVLLLAPVLGYWQAGRATHAIGAIIATAERLRPSQLNERLPVMGAGDELDRLALTINGLLDRIAVYLQRKRDFLADAAHELRTPLAAIQSSIEVALHAERSVAEYQELLLRLLERGSSLRTMVNQLLLIMESEAERLDMDTELVRLDDVARTSADMFGGVAESRGIRLTCRTSGPTLVRGRRHLLMQLINNLLDNALKYTPTGGQVDMTLSLDDDGRTAVLTVADSGVGIANEELSRVFERFFRIDGSRSRDERATGAGLGLSICQAVTLAHRGTIVCESEPGRGARFIARLPLDEPTAAPTG